MIEAWSGSDIQCLYTNRYLPAYSLRWLHHSIRIMKDHWWWVDHNCLPRTYYYSRRYYAGSLWWSKERTNQCSG